MKKFILTLLIISAALPFAPGCSQKNNAQYWQYDYYSVMNTDATLKVFLEPGGDGEEYARRFTELAKDVKTLLSDLENSLSADIGSSSVGRFNAAAAGEEVEIDVNAYNALETAMDVYYLTDGAYNPAVYYSVRAFGFENGGKFPQKAEDMPTEEETSLYAQLAAHFSETKLFERDGKYFAEKPSFTVSRGGETLSLKLDLGGIGKGCAADGVKKLLDEYGFGYGYFFFGSSSIAFGKYPDESLNFDLHFTNPRAGDGFPQSYFLTEVSDVCVSTSADKNAFTLDADGDGVPERYCHIFDPSTGRPVSTGVISATVIGGAAAENDALTTAIMAMGAQKAVDFINSVPNGRRVVFAYETNGGLGIYTNMPEDSYTVEDSRYTVGLPPETGGGDVA